MTTKLQKTLNAIKLDKDTNLKAENLKLGVTLLGVEGTLTNLDTSDATATDLDILIGKTAYANNTKITGTLPNYEPYTELSVSNAYSSSSNLIIRNDSSTAICLQPNSGFTIENSIIASAIQLSPTIIKEGSSILGVEGTLKVGVDTTDGTALVDDIALNKVAYVNGNRLVGTIPTHNNDSILNTTTLTYSSTGLQTQTQITQKEIIDTTSTISIDIPNNLIVQETELTEDIIKLGTVLFGVTGTLDPIPDNTTRLNSGNTTYYVTNNVSTNSSYLNITYTATKNILAYINAPINIQVSNTNVANTIGLTSDILKEGETILGVTGTYVGEAGAGTEDATAIVSDIIEGKTAYVNGQKITGTLPLITTTFTPVLSTTSYNNTEGEFTLTTTNVNNKYPIGVVIRNTNMQFTVPQSQIVNAIGLTPDMIAEGVTVLGITGTHTGNGMLTEEEYQECENLTDEILAEEGE